MASSYVRDDSAQFNTSTAPITFQFDNDAVRVITHNGDPWFVGKDVAATLGYADTKQAIRMHCKGGVESTLPSPGGPQLTKIIPERDVYRLIMRSKLPTAERFEEWVVGEVLPTIRRTGGYQAPSPIDDRIERLLTVAENLASALNTALAAPKPKKQSTKRYTPRKPRRNDPWEQTVIEWADAQNEPFRLIDMRPAIEARHSIPKLLTSRGYILRIAGILRLHGYANRNMRPKGRMDTSYWSKNHA